MDERHYLILLGNIFKITHIPTIFIFVESYIIEFNLGSYMIVNTWKYEEIKPIMFSKLLTLPTLQNFEKQRNNFIITPIITQQFI